VSFAFVHGACAAGMILAVVYASQAIAIRALGVRDPCARWTAAAVAGICAAIAAFHALAALGRFRLAEGGGVAALAALTALATTRVGPVTVARALGTDFAALVRFVLGDKPNTRIVRAAVASLPCFVIARAMILPPLGYDTLTYHGVKAAMWVQTGGDLPLRMPGGWSVYRWYPYAGEVLGAWAMLPFHDDTLYLWVDAALWLLWLPVVAALGAELRVAERLRPALCLYVMTVPAIYYFVPSGYVDVLAYFLLIAMLLFTTRVIRGRTPAASACFAIAASVTAIAVKFTSLLWPVLAGVVMLAAAFGNRALRVAVVRGMAIGALVGAATLGPILLRNVVGQGAPFSPFPLRVLGITLGVAPPETNWYNQVTPELTSFANEQHQLSMMLGFESPLKPTLGRAALPLMLVGLSYGLWRLFRERRLIALLFGLFAAAHIATYLHPDFAGTRQAYGTVNARFFVVLTTLGALLVARLWQAPRAQLLQALYFVAASGASMWFYQVVLVSPLEVLPLLAFIAICFIALVIAAWSIAHIDAGIAAALVLGGIVLGLTFGTAPLRAYRASIRYAALASSSAGHRIAADWSALAPLVDQPGTPHRIAVTAGPRQRHGAQHMYFFLGSALQNELFYVSPRSDNAIPVYDSRAPQMPGLNGGTWVTRLRQSRTEFVLAMQPAWLEARFMKAYPLYFKLVGESQRATWLYRLRP
jgi:hypothetical protein